MNTARSCGRRLVGAAPAALAAGLLLAAPVAPAAQDCTQELERIEAQMAGAELTWAQRDYIRDLIEAARTFAENNNVRACRQTIVDLAEYVQEEIIDMPLAREARDWAPAVADTPENLRDQPPQPEYNVPNPEVRVGETPVPLPVPAPEVTVEQAEPEVAIEPANPNVIIERAEPNVTIEQAEPRVTIERMGGGG